MQNVTQDWEQTNRSNLTRPANIILSMSLNDGREPIITNQKLISFSYIKAGDPLSSILTQDSITFTIDNTDGRFSYDPETSDIYKNAFVSVTCGFMKPNYQDYDGISGGKYYISDVDMNATQERISFTAKTILAFMKAKCSPISTDAYTAAMAIISQAESDDGVPVSSITRVFDQTIMSEFNVSITANDSYSMAEALQLIANACGCVLYVDRNGAVHIEPLATETENYVISNRFCYEMPKVTYGERVGKVRLNYNHGSGTAVTASAAAKDGGTQICTNPIMTTDFDALDRARAIATYYQTSRRKIGGKYRADPRIDLFDIVVIPNGDTVSACCITNLNLTFNGGWRGTFEAIEIPGAELNMRICDIEQLTVKQLESLAISQLDPNNGGE